MSELQSVTQDKIGWGEKVHTGLFAVVFVVIVLASLFFIVCVAGGALYVIGREFVLTSIAQSEAFWGITP